MSVRIGLGLAGYPFSDADDFWRWVDLCEESDVDSLWQSDRLVSRDPTPEAMSLMAALAGRTRRLKFGMSVVVVGFRDPLLLAKQCATIDHLSNGRLLPGFGIGPAHAPEWRATGRETRGRGRRADEILEIMARLWSEERVDFDGEFYRYRQVSIAPRPVQQPLPLWIGGSSEAAVRRTATLGTGWIAGIQTADQVAPVVEAVRKASEAARRPIDPDHYGAGFAYRFGGRSDPIVERAGSLYSRLVQDFDPAQYFAVGGADEILAQVERYRSAGISKFVLRPLAADTREVMEQTERLCREVIPEVHG